MIKRKILVLVVAAALSGCATDLVPLIQAIEAQPPDENSCLRLSSDVNLGGGIGGANGDRKNGPDVHVHIVIGVQPHQPV